MQCPLYSQSTETPSLKDGHHLNSKDDVVLTKFYVDFYANHCYHLLLECFHRAHFHCQMRLLHQSYSPEDLFSIFLVIKICTIVIRRNYIHLKVMLYTILVHQDKQIGNSVSLTGLATPF